MIARAIFVHVALWLAACGASPSDGNGGKGGSSPVNTYGQSPCGTCIQQACSTEYTACGSDPECQSYADCIAACGLGATGNADAACVAACPAGGSNAAKTAIAKVEECRIHVGAPACAACGAPSTVYEHPLLNQMCPAASTDPTACGQCEDHKCCDTYSAAHANPEAVALANCLKTCSTAACKAQCLAMHSTGADDFGKRLACDFVLCLDACAPGTTEPVSLCIANQCGDEYMTYQAAPGGYAMSVCLDVCAVDDDVCYSKCYAAYPEAYATYDAFGQCVLIGCGLG